MASLASAAPLTRLFGYCYHYNSYIAPRNKVDQALITEDLIRVSFIEQTHVLNIHSSAPFFGNTNQINKNSRDFLYSESISSLHPVIRHCRLGLRCNRFLVHDPVGSFRNCLVRVVPKLHEIVAYFCRCELPRRDYSCKPIGEAVVSCRMI